MNGKGRKKGRTIEQALNGTHDARMIDDEVYTSLLDAVLHEHRKCRTLSLFWAREVPHPPPFNLLIDGAGKAVEFIGTQDTTYLDKSGTAGTGWNLKCGATACGPPWRRRCKEDTYFANRD